MTEIPLVSVLMNCFNGAKYIEKAIDSVIRQTFSAWELLVWDNQSTDNSRNIVNLYKDERIRYFSAESHTSLGEARELVRKQALAEWITVLDVDDYWLENNLELKLRSPVSDDVGLIYSRYLVDRSTTGKTSFVMPMREVLDEGFIFGALAEKNFIGAHTAIYRNQSINEVGGFRPLPFSTDYDLNLRVSKDWRVKAVDQVTAVYRVHGQNYSIRNRHKMIEERETLIRELPAHLQVSASSAFFVDQFLSWKMNSGGRAICWGSATKIRVFLNILQRLIRRVGYQFSFTRRSHNSLVKQIISD